MNAQTHRRWQKWTGAEVAGLAGLPPGQLMKATITGLGAVHFTRDPKGVALVHGPVGLGPAAASDLQNAAWDAASTAAAAIANDSSNYCTSVGQTGSPVNSAVHAFKVAWNAWQTAEVSPPNLVPVGTGKFEPSVSAAMASLIGTAPTGCSGGVSPPPPPPGNVVCADGSSHPAGYVCPQPQPAPAPATSNTLYYVLGGAGLLALVAVGVAVMKKPSSKELATASQRHAQRATTHRQMSGHLRHAAGVRAREEAAEARRAA